MKRFLRAAAMTAALSAVAGAAGCAVDSINTANTNTAPANPAASPAPSASPVRIENTRANDLPLTLPVLDAMFADEPFAGELKSKLQLTDEQVGRLRTIAREETARLRENEGDDYTGTTASATARAAEEVRSAVGEEKAQQLAELVRDRWSGGTESGAANPLGTVEGSKPNAVPTDTRVVVNGPAYRMDVFENGKLIKTYKVGIGYPEFPLPTGMRKAETIIFNPTWTPPDEPWVEGSDKVKAGQKVEAGSKLNPLGPVKIPIGMPSLIHGGKTPAKLGTFASHGCVGLTDPLIQDFSLVLAKIGGAELTPEDVATYAKNRTETKNVKLSSAVPVELRYETIVLEDGKLHIYRDVYDRGTNTEENLRAVLQVYGVSLDQLSEQERTQAMDALREMARDASGNPTDGQPSASPGGSPNANANSNVNNANVNSNMNSNKSVNKNTNIGGDRVTRTVKGKKEIVIPIAALAGKGYPVAVGVDMGSVGKVPARKKR